jgi:hypothetical protein
MSVERTEIEKSVEEVLKKFMVDKAMSEGVHAFSTSGLQASPLTGRRSSLVNPATEKKSKNRDDLAKTKQISSILLDYILPLAGAVNRNKIPWDIEYTLITAYILKGDTHRRKPVGTDPSIEEQRFQPW